MSSFTHRQRFVRHPLLQPQRFSSGQHLATSGSVIHSGCQQLSIICQPQSEGLGNMGWETNAWLHTWPAWYAAHLMCSTSASCVGGMFSTVLPFCAKSFLRAALTVVQWEERSYRSTTKRSISAKHCNYQKYHLAYQKAGEKQQSLQDISAMLPSTFSFLGQQSHIWCHTL